MTDVQWARLTIAADQVDDLERVRIATANRLRAVAQEKQGEDSPEAESIRAQLEAIAQAEKTAVGELQRAMKRHPLAPFVSSITGIGEKTVARLLGVIGDPLYRFDPKTGTAVKRTLAQLRSYCGCGDPKKDRLKKGVKARHNAEAKKRIHVIAAAAIKNRCEPCRQASLATEGWTPPPSECRCAKEGRRYRAIYDEARLYEETRTDEGAAETDGHRHNRALRKVKKAFIADLQDAAREAI